ncbi:GxxExxY protein [Flavobacterium sp. FPG59]|jgi:GxxExxY protein|uniref:GxxExxY protein n=1 Tax=Flavobacterium sp. FPG59 TaxID=1929267 RepID=UPI000A3B1479|nr:GxxExxY protein [Flavobacterium sp. FPG59]OUD36172.1 GxxExxY protein [Flavobacterium sp. FPG59]
MEEELSKIPADLESLSYKIIGLAIEVHRQLGPGLLESAYQQCLFYEIKKAGFKVEKEVMLPIIYKEIKIDHGYRIDLLIEDKLVVELKTVESFTSVHFAQILTYLKLGQYPLGLLINYNSKILKNNIKRFINTAREL